MKISIASDLHLEYKSLDLENKHGSDVLVLAGDIVVASRIERFPFNNISTISDSKIQKESLAYRQFFKQVSERWKHVIYVAGNHEYYVGVFNRTDDLIQENLAHINVNIHYLNLDAVQIDDVVFAGGTLWTNLNNRDPLTEFYLEKAMNDYNCIRLAGHGTSYRKLTPLDTARQHDKTVQYLRSVVSDNFDKNMVIVTHHAPTFLSISPKYQNDQLMSGGYASDLSNFILDNKNIKLWVHGHVHDNFDYMVGEHTRVVCNPRGYFGLQPQAEYFKIKTVEI